MHSEEQISQNRKKPCGIQRATRSSAGTLAGAGPAEPATEAVATAAAGRTDGPWVECAPPVPAPGRAQGAGVSAIKAAGATGAPLGAGGVGGGAAVSGDGDASQVAGRREPKRKCWMTGNLPRTWGGREE